MKTEWKGITQKILGGFFYLLLLFRIVFAFYQITKGWLFLSSKMVLLQLYFLTPERKTFYSNAFHLLDGVDDLFQPSLFLSNVVVSSWFSTLMRFIRELFGVGAGSKKSWKLLCCFL